MRNFKPGNNLFKTVITDNGEIYNSYLCKACSDIIYLLDYGREGNIYEIDEGFVLNEMIQNFFEGTPEEYYIKLSNEQPTPLKHT